MNEDNVKETVTEEVKEEQVAEEVKEEVKPSKKEIKNKLKEENQKLTLEVEELKNQLLRNRADLENFKKHMKEEAIKDRKYASMNLVDSIVTPVDYLLKACEYQSTSPEMNNFLIGFKMIANQIKEVLEGDGLKEIDATIGMEFDPNIHHAVETEKVEGSEPNKIVGVLVKGYKYKDRILKPAMVKVSE